MEEVTHYYKIDNTVTVVFFGELDEQQFTKFFNRFESSIEIIVFKDKINNKTVVYNSLEDFLQNYM